MAFDFRVFGSGQLDEQFVDWLVKERALDLALHFEKLWSYYQNEMQELYTLNLGDRVNESARPYRQTQEYGLPSRITGMNYSFYGGILGGSEVRGIERKEVVIENDIAWRIDTMVDFLFGKDTSIVSRAADPQRAREIQQILEAVFAANGGATYFQQLALLGSIFGFVDVILRWGGMQGLTRSSDESKGTEPVPGEDEVPGGSFAGDRPKHFDEVLRRARNLMLEAIEAPRSLPILDPNDYRKLDFYIQHYFQQHNQLAQDAGDVITTNRFARQSSCQKETHNVEILGPRIWQRYEDRQLVAQGVNPLGVVPVVHIQNMPLPLRYEGQGDVEPLMPLQDELNTRLSDRASRITFQSFKMFLGKGIEGFEDRAVAPGRMWSTENPEAAIEEFGGDPGSPSEESHINHIRESLDKASGVASIAAGILKGRIGNLTSAVALKMTLMGVLSKTERKRKSYGQGIKEICNLVLLALDTLGVYPNCPEEREIEIHWPSPLPENLMEKLQEAQLKKKLGVPQEQILKELGYSEVRDEE